MKGQTSDAAGLSSCTYGNPQVPVLNGQPTDVLVKIAGSNGERPGQAREFQEIARRNAAEVQPVRGLGDQADWDGILRTLWVVKGNPGVNVNVGSDLGGLKTARGDRREVLARLPETAGVSPGLRQRHRQRAPVVTRRYGHAPSWFAGNALRPRPSCLPQARGWSAMGLWARGARSCPPEPQFVRSAIEISAGSLLVRNGR